MIQDQARNPKGKKGTAGNKSQNRCGLSDPRPSAAPIRVPTGLVRARVLLTVVMNILLSEDYLYKGKGKT